MKLWLHRALRGRDIELGLLYVERRRECMVEIIGSAAIASGRYRVELRPDHRFGRVLPVLVDDWGMASLRIVPGGSLKGWIPGCLVLAQEGPAGSGIRRTPEAFDSVFAQIEAAIACDERVRIRIL